MINKNIIICNKETPTSGKYFVSLRQGLFFKEILRNRGMGHRWEGWGFGPGILFLPRPEPVFSFTLFRSVQTLTLVLSDWRPVGRGFNPHRGRQHSFVEIDHEIFSTVILSLPLIQEGQLSVSGERMCTILVNRLED